VYIRKPQGFFSDIRYLVYISDVISSLSFIIVYYGLSYFIFFYHYIKMDITHIRRMNINQGRVKSNETNRLKGIRKFIKSTTKRGVIINEIIDDLIQTKYYEYIYNIEEHDLTFGS
jgi:hypothetical protein